MAELKDVTERFGVSRETYERLKAYQELLLRWQNKINLVGPDTVQDVWQCHFIDSLQLLPLIANPTLRSVDFGSGAGFPGMVLAIAGLSDMHLVDSDTKKITFLKEVARITETPVAIHHGRIEQTSIENVQMIFSRACSSLDELFRYAEKVVSRETICYFHKGKNYSKELLDANKNWMFDYDVYTSVTDTQSAILKVEHLTKIP